ncbi:hypothetical protein ABZX51_011066 [Aspergillus tubingensis]
MADPLEFNNPFWEALPEGDIGFADAPISPSDISVGTATLGIVGQGTIAVKSRATQNLEFCVSNVVGSPKFWVNITRNTCTFSKGEPNGERTPYVSECLRPEAVPYLPEAAPPDGVTHWLSIDKSNCRMRYGKYYTCNALTIERVSLNEDGPLLQKLTTVSVNDEISPVTIKRFPLPVTKDLPPLVVSNESVSLRDLDLARVTTWANLPRACQTLYHNIVGQGIKLKTDDFEDLPEAIHRSIKTPGHWGYEKLRMKCTNPDDPDPAELVLKYLRVTIGSNKGNSPGIPYVMEVWPPGHRSVIHDHGKACAVIRVLSGTINCTWYDSLDTEGGPRRLGNTAEFREGQVTWLGENHYQVHSLENRTQQTCITLQCYEFAENDNIHDENFWYIDGVGGEKRAWPPTSDCTFADFYNIMRRERDA